MGEKRKGPFRMNLLKQRTAKLIFDGVKSSEIVKLLFPVWNEDGTLNEAKKRSAEARVSQWCGEPEFQAYYRELVKREAIPRYSRAMSLLDKQLSDGNAWVAQGAARELINQVSTMVMGEEKQEVVVRVEGAPVMGEPDDDDEAEDE